MLKLTILVLALTSGAALAEERDCLFGQHKTPEGTFAINLPITIAAEAGQATIAVRPTAKTYAATVTRGANGSAEFAFVSEVAPERITVSPQGEALWQVSFTDGRAPMFFLGKCAPARG